MKKLFFLLALFSLGFSKIIFAQFYIVGQDPASVKWKQLTTPNFKIIFPSGYYINANLYANTLELTHGVTLKPYLTKKPKPFTIVLHSKSTWANAMVLPAPLHGDFFEIPDQNLYPQIWQYQLSLHEYRHYAQMRKMYEGVGKGLSYIFGQAGPMALFGIFIPMWFVEGDAVYNETIHSKSGRGRLPYFSMDLKAQLLEKKIYPYDKAILGSYRSYVPDYYTLGYQLVQYGAEHYGYEMWNLALDRVARRPYLLKPFVNGLKTYTGLRKVKYYHKVMGALQSEWSAEQKKKQFSAAEYLNPAKPHRSFTSYHFPVMLPDGAVIAERTSIDDIHRFVMISPDGEETVLFTPGFDYAESLSANDSLICWNEKEYDLRWSNRDYSIIKIYNYKTKALKTLTRQTRLFAPDLSPDATKIVAVAVSVDGQNALQVLDIKTGKVIKKFSTENNLFFMTPRWSTDGQTIVATVLGKKGKSILLWNPETGNRQLVLPFGFAEINRPFKSGNNIYYTGTYDGVNNIYQLHLPANQISQITTVKYGVENGTVVNGDMLVFSDYTAEGYRIATMKLSAVKSKTEIEIKPYSFPIDSQVTKSTFVLEDTLVPDSNYRAAKYSRIKHLFNLHSWGPMAVDVNTYQTIPNLVMASQNMLGTAVSTLGYYYDINEHTGKTKFTFDYYGWYPVMGFQATYGERKQTYVNSEGLAKLATWHETNLSLHISVPLRFIKSKWISGITPKASVGQRFMKLNESQDVSFKEDQFTFLTYSLYGYHSLKRSRRDLFSKWSQRVYAVFSHTPFSANPSSVGYVSGTFTLPGFFNHHGLKLYLAKEWKKSGNYPYGDYIAIPRGYSNLSIKEMVSLKSDYAFPIAYPDWDIQSAAFLTRVYAHLFFDYALYRDNNGFNNNLGSTGIELYTNWYFLSLPVELTLGFRGSYKLSGAFVPEFLLEFSL
ncbi:MAG: hypothetical protein DRJ09_11510 [Bacteroidetes bacterium]|nr:MAG: hypothetical protein DRJ09_11510 [Bacteroidota bacterium]